MWLFHYFNLKKYYDVLKSKSRCILFNKNINFNKNETELKIENFTNGFRDTNLVLQLRYESQIKSKTAMSWSSRKKKKRAFFVPFVLSEGNFFKICVLYQYIHSVLNTLSIYILLHIKKHYFLHFCCLFLKSLKAYSVYP